MPDLVREFEKEQIGRQPGEGRDIPEFVAGDEVKVHLRIPEAEKERIQIYDGIVIARKSGGLRETFTVRKISYGVGVERTFPLHSPMIAKIEIAKKGDARRAKLYYLRKKKK